ncbi:response regulator of citrate/malate metabolism [Caldalkalibacillus uzonensis]|uniref:Response regulator of citrate/malate metabolism n=1 Tax=Caldalkalibacillus uzonensis TaxID=353224 RepID=A0ABU0CNM7_9BACI|nr:response regulator [Caldalkalibacillus uzonensis]MDQ0338009.1 response regulator of citrate/malate metabolism [Caldalkalibacillus uzonensis]
MIKVFIVEDDPMVLEVNKGFLERVENFRLVDSATTGEEAMDRLKHLSVDLVLLDYYLPDLPGKEVLTWMRQENLAADVIMITAARDVSTVKEMFRYGVIDYLVKPFRFERFKAALETYRNMWLKLNQVTDLSQEEIDALKPAQPTKGEMTATGLEEIPKGLSEVTLKQIVSVLEKQNVPVKATDIGNQLGMARVTVRRYLDFLVQEGQAEVHIHYGNIGRPSHYYTFKKQPATERSKRPK